MNALLDRLGIPPEIRAFFNVPADLCFSYVDQQEVYGQDFHRVPSTSNLWVARGDYATHIVITYSVMEAMAFITLNRHRYPRLEQLAFIAIGNRLHPRQSKWIRENFPKRKYTLVFGRDLLGRLTDIKLAAGISNVPARIYHSGTEIMIYRGNKSGAFNAEELSLHAFQEAFGIRPRFRTAKPVQSLTFLDQLKNDTER